jgi:hypothetical protein
MAWDFGSVILMQRKVNRMRVNISMIKNVDMVYSNGEMVIYIKEIFLMMFVMDMVKCIGVMGLIIRVCGS